MKEATFRRIELAKPISSAYASNPNVQAVIVAGSVAHGWADAYSDLEIDVFWTQPPSDEDRLAVIRRLKAELVHLHPYEEDEWSEVYKVDGLKIEVSQFLSSTFERYMEDVLHKFDTSANKQVYIAAVQHSVPLYGQEIVESWKQRLANYPVGLARAMVIEHMDFQPAWYYESLAARDDAVMLHEVYCDVIKNVMGVLLGLNRIYLPHPRFKWMEQLINEMTFSPADLGSRIRRIFKEGSMRGLRLLQELAEEVMLLIEDHFPDLEIKRPMKAAKWE